MKAEHFNLSSIRGWALLPQLRGEQTELKGHKRFRITCMVIAQIWVVRVQAVKFQHKILVCVALVWDQCSLRASFLCAVHVQGRMFRGHSQTLSTGKGLLDKLWLHIIKDQDADPLQRLVKEACGRIIVSSPSISNG